MAYKIYGEVYELSPTSRQVPDAYAIHGEVVDSKPKGKLVGYTKMSDGSIIACYKKFNPLVVILPLTVVTCIGACVACYFLFIQPKDVVIDMGGGSMPIEVKTGTDENVVQYNGFMSVDADDTLGVGFVNGDYECTVTIEGEGIESQTFTLQPGERLERVPIKYTTEDGVTQATLMVVTDTSTLVQNVVIEIPKNNTPNSANTSLEGYWKGEFIYGVHSVNDG